MDDIQPADIADEAEELVKTLTGSDDPELQRLVREIALDALDVAAEGGDDAQELVDQLRMLAEDRRIEAVEKGWQIVGHALRLLIFGRRLSL